MLESLRIRYRMKTKLTNSAKNRILVDAPEYQTAISQVITKLGSKKKSKVSPKILTSSAGTNSSKNQKQRGKRLLNVEPKLKVKVNKSLGSTSTLSLIKDSTDLLGLNSPVKAGKLQSIRASKEFVSGENSKNILTIVPNSQADLESSKTKGNSPAVKKGLTKVTNGPKVLFNLAKTTNSKHEEGKNSRSTKGALGVANSKFFNKLESPKEDSNLLSLSKNVGGKHLMKNQTSVVKLTQNNLSSELHGYRMETDKEYRKHIQNLNRLRPTTERKLKPIFGLHPIKEKVRENLGCLGVHPHNYDSLIGYRKGVPIVNNQKTLEGVRRVLNYLTKVINTPDLDLTKENKSKMELLVILDNVPNLDTAEGQNNYLSLLTITIARIKPLQNLVIVPKTMKEAIRYLTSRATIPMTSSNHDKVSLNMENRNQGQTSVDSLGHTRKKLNLTRVGTNPENLCGVLMINPAKSKLSDLANLVFSKNSSGKGVSSTQSSLGAIGSLCAKKGIPLISLCDVSSPLTYSTYPIICNTRNLSEVYLVLDLLSYGLNKAANDYSEN